MKKGGRLSQVKELGYLLTFMNRKRKTQYAIGLAVTALTQTLFLIALRAWSYITWLISPCPEIRP